ncbi:MAG: hypothetical protein IIW27_03580 [Clostridia bacterium]|nr:hypothetical protein [Clostridia bacterium]
MKLKTIRLLRALLGVIGILLLGVFLALGVHLYDPFQEGGALHAEWLILFACVTLLGGVLSAFLHPLFHEVGHILFGTLAGMRLLSFRVWFLEVERENGSFRVRFVKEGGGRTAMLPKSGEKIRRKTAVFAIGGLVGTLVYFACCALVIRFSPVIPFWAYALLGVGVVTATIEFFSNLIPSEGSEQTDGELLFALWKNTPSVKIMLAVMCAEGELLSGKRPREINPAYLFNLPTVQEDDVNFIALLTVRATYFLDQGNFADLAKTYARLETLTDYVSDSSALAIRAEILYFGLISGEKGFVSRHREVIEPLKNQKTALAYRVRAAYELYEESNLPVAHVLLNRYQKAVEKCTVAGEKLLEQDLMQAMANALFKREREEIKHLDRLQKEKTVIYR